MIWVAWPPASTTTFSPAFISLAFQPPHISHVVHYSYFYLNTTQSFQAFTTTTRTFSRVSDLSGFLPPTHTTTKYHSPVNYYNKCYYCHVLY